MVRLSALTSSYLCPADFLEAAPVVTHLSRRSASYSYELHLQIIICRFCLKRENATEQRREITYIRVLMYRVFRRKKETAETRLKRLYNY